MNSKDLVVERRYDAPVKKVWDAITVNEQMKKWYFQLDEFRPEVGFKFNFYGEGHKGEKYLHRCEVTEVIPEKKITYSWKYEGFEGISYVTFELFEEGEQTLVRLTHRGLDSFPGDNPDFAATSFEQGWKEILGTYLNNHLAS